MQSRILGMTGILASILVLRLFAQTPNATLVGTVYDSSRAVIQGAVIELRNVETNQVRKSASDGRGEFTIPNLAPGAYEITIAKEGFRTRRETGVELQLDQVARLELRLEVGDVSQSVEVTASVPLINTENSSKGEVMTADEIAQMPLEGRDFSDLALLVPSVVANAEGAQGGPFSVNGARADDSNFLLDGFNDQSPRQGGAYVQPNLEALQEFKMQTANYSAEYGRRAGGVLNMVLKTGGNRLRGALFEFLRNDALDARNFFDEGKSKLRQNQFGANLSGPVFIPKVYNGRDRTFFLFSWESFRQRRGQSRVNVVPTPAMLVGDFSGLAPIKDPLAAGSCGASGGAACFPGNKIPLSRMSPVALKLQAYYPLPNRPGQLNNHLSYATAPNDWDSYIIKIDQRISDKDTLSFRYTRRNSRSIDPYYGNSTLGLFGAKPKGAATLAGVTYSRNFTPTLINETRIGFSRGASASYGFHAGHDYNAELGLPGPTDPRLTGFPLIQITGFDALGDGANLPRILSDTSVNAADTLTWVKGRHLLKFGGEAVRARLNEPWWNNSPGTFRITGAWTGNSYADFLLGLLNLSIRTVKTSNIYIRAANYGFFAQDDWKAATRLTLSFGLRYELAPPLAEKYGRTSNFIPGLNKVVIGSQAALDASGVTFANSNSVMAASQLGIPAMAYTNYKNFAPRFGFAWRPLGSNRMAVRGGYGIFYGGSQLNSTKNQIGAVFPFVISQTTNRNATNPLFLTFANPFPTPANLTGDISSFNLTGYELNAPTQYLQSWNLTIEREIGLASAIEISYSGSKGTHLGLYLNLNQPYWPLRPAPNNVDYPGFGTINYYTFAANSIYNAATISLRRRFTRGVFYTINYQYSKSIDEGNSQLAGGSSGGINGPQNVHCIRCDRGRSDWDTPHAFTMSFSWLSPLRRHAMFRGWQLAGTGRSYTGAPFTPRLASVSAGQPNRPNRIAKGTVPNPGVERWFDVSAFPRVPSQSYLFGNSGRSILDGPGRIEANVNLSRNFSVGERTNLQVRWELFNVVNRANFRLPVRDVDVANAATLTQAANGRLMQFGLRYSF